MFCQQFDLLKQIELLAYPVVPRVVHSVQWTTFCFPLRDTGTVRPYRCCFLTGLLPVGTAFAIIGTLRAPPRNDQVEKYKLLHAKEDSGLGLSILNKMVELLNGKIEVESKIGGGTAFSVSLPAK